MANEDELKKIFGFLTEEQIWLLALAFPLHAKNPRLFTMPEKLTVLEYAKAIITDFAVFTDEEKTIVFSEMTAFNQSIIDRVQPSIEGETNG